MLKHKERFPRHTASKQWSQDPNPDSRARVHSVNLAILRGSATHLGSHSNACMTVFPTDASHTARTCRLGSWWETLLCGSQLLELYFNVWFISLFIFSSHLPLVWTDVKASSLTFQARCWGLVVLKGLYWRWRCRGPGDGVKLLGSQHSLTRSSIAVSPCPQL